MAPTCSLDLGFMCRVRSRVQDVELKLDPKAKKTSSLVGNMN
jgi:hypothetical protein